MRLTARSRGRWKRRRGLGCLLLLFSSGLPGNASGQSVVDLREVTLPPWELGTERLRIGSVDGEHDAFVQIAQLRIDDEGLIYVLDTRLPGLLVYDRDGRFVRQIGRRGDGPGEYRRPGPFGLLGDTVWIAESKRAAFFERDGTFLGSVSFADSDPGRAGPLLVNLLGPDELLVIDPVGIPGLTDRPVGRVFFHQYVIRRNLEGSVQDTIVGRILEPGVLLTRAGGNGILIYPPVRDQPLVSYDPHRDELLEVARPIPTSAEVGAFTVSVRRRDGSDRRARTFRFRPAPLPARVRDSIRARVVDRLPPGSRQRDVALEHLPDPGFLPPVSGITRAEDGRFWVARESSGGASREEYLILDPDLRPVAEMTLPPDVRPVGFGGDELWVVEKERFDVPYLVEYRIER